MTEDKKRARDKVSDGIRQGIGVLSAFKDALEETINEARERGDLSSDRAKEVMKGALHKAQEAAEGARDRLDFVSQKEFDALATAVEGIRERVRALEARFAGSEAPRDEAGSTDEVAGKD
jgi:polyhydroxyalkanoate synthesis regulator phasin